MDRLPPVEVSISPEIHHALHGAVVTLTCTVSEEASRIIWERTDNKVIPVGGRFSLTLARFVKEHNMTIDGVTVSANQRAQGCYAI